MDRITFPGLHADDFVADTDRKALAALKRIPLLPKVMQKFYEVGADRWLYCWNMATSVRCGPTQFATLDGILKESASILDMPAPELYVTGNPFPNAFTGGVERPYITVRSSMIDTLSDEQLFHLMGHELGHIKAGHVLYKSIARLLMPLLELLGRRTFGVSDAVGYGLMMAFMEWSRQAELTADRAGLLCAQDFDLSASANLALCAGPSRLAHEMNPDAFLDQSRVYQDMNDMDSIGKVLVYMFYGSMTSHPMPVHRTKMLEKWLISGQFERIIRGEYPGAPSEAAS
jgi:Zn-dependent protease with chaperone function